MIRLWFSAVHYWKKSKGKDGLTLPFLLACERIERGELLTAVPSAAELLRLLVTMTETTPDEYLGRLYQCPVINNPVVGIYPLSYAPYYSSEIRWGQAFYADRALFRSGLERIGEAAKKLWRELEDPLKRNHFWYDETAQIYVPFGEGACRMIRSAKDYTALKFRD